VDARGVEGHIKVNEDTLPSRVDFTVAGSQSVIDANTRKQNFMTWLGLVAQGTPLLQAEGATGKFYEILMRAAAELDIDNAGSLLALAPAGPPPNPAGQPGLLGNAAGAVARIVGP
jgi:hypothetical protein